MSSYSSAKSVPTSVLHFCQVFIWHFKCTHCLNSTQDKNRSKQNTWFPNDDLCRQEWNAFLRIACGCSPPLQLEWAEVSITITPLKVEHEPWILKEWNEDWSRWGNVATLTMYPSRDGNTRTGTTVTTTHMLIAYIKYGKTWISSCWIQNCIITRLAARQSFTCFGFLTMKHKLCKAQMTYFYPCYCFNGNTKWWLYDDILSSSYKGWQWTIWMWSHPN